MIKILITTLLLMLSHFKIYSQVTEEWVNRYNHTTDSTDYAWSVEMDMLGNIYVAGQVFNVVTGFDMCLIKYDNNGAMQWARTFDGPVSGDDALIGMVLDNAGNIYTTGFSERAGTGKDFCTTKFDSLGNPEWMSYYNSVSDSTDEAYLITRDNSGNLYVSGNIKGNSSDIIVIKYNSSGAEQWVRIHNGPANGWDRTNGIEIDDSNNVYALGFISTLTSSLDYCIIKYNSAGVQQWIKTYNGTGNNFDLPNAMTLDDSANVYITGTSVGTSSGDFLTIKYDRNGYEKWTQRYNAPANNSDAGSGIAVDDDENVYAFGESVGIGSNYDWLLIKYNSAGVQQWLQRYNGTGNDFDDADGVMYNDGNLYVMGASTGVGSEFDYLLIKYDSSGNLKWQQRYNGTGNALDFPSHIYIDSLNNLFLTGNSLNSAGNMDIVTIKYSQTVGILNNLEFITNEFILYQNFPNPFNPSTEISYEVNLTDALSKVPVTLKAYDITGKEVATLVNEIQSSGKYSVTFDAGNLNTGIYFYRLKSNGNIQTKKMIVIK